MKKLFKKLGGQLDFNSNMVRLRGPGLDPFRIGPYLFQFQYGAIESLIELPLVVYLYAFQFQYGAIESNSSTSATYFVETFQFQYGAIERQ